MKKTQPQTKNQKNVKTVSEKAALPDKELAKLSDELEKKEAKIAELTEDLQRTRADFENFRRQVEAQKEQRAASAKLSTVKKLLPLLDDFSRAIAAQPKELGPLAKNLEKTLVGLELSKVNSASGVEFNPDLHSAISVEGDGDHEQIAETLQTGYYYQGELLRPALVRVKKS